MVLQQSSERRMVMESLSAGRLSVADEHGFHHWLWAACPDDGQRAHVHRTIWKRDSRGRYIAAVIFRCGACTRTWQATTDEIRLT
jgi:hypothetical protein